MRKKIAFLQNSDRSLYIFRLAWMKYLFTHGYDVYAIIPKGEYFSKFEESGVHAIEYTIERNVGSVLNEIKTLFRLLTIFKENKFDILHTFAFKPNIYGSFVGKIAGIRCVINTVEGLGRIYSEKGIVAKLKQIIVSFFYFLAFGLAKKVVFMNKDDLDLLSFCVKRDRTLILPGTGVDTYYFKVVPEILTQVENLKKELNISRDAVSITVIARLLIHKGIYEYIKAAKVLSEKRNNLIFLIVGWIDKGNLAAMPEKVIQRAAKEKYIRVTGERTDIRELLAVTDIFVLPSFYREGLPTAILEAMAMGKPIVTTDMPGCRETVENGINGFLVPAKDSVALANAIERLILDKDLREKMGKASREIVERQFSNDVVIPQVLNLYEELLETSTAS